MELKQIIESIIFTSQEPLSTKAIRDILSSTADQSEEAKSFKKIKDEEVVRVLDEMIVEYEQAGRSFRLLCIAGNYQFCIRPEYAPWAKTMVGEKNRPPRLSQAALETLAIIAYRQPITRAEIEQIRGVAVDGVMQTLLERNLVQQAGRAEVVGRPMTYATTTAFMEYFGLRSLEELPSADELRRIPVTKPETLLTAEPNGAAPSQETASSEPVQDAAPAAAAEPDVPHAPEQATDSQPTSDSVASDDNQPAS